MHVIDVEAIVSRVQEIFTHANLYFVPGKVFSDKIDLLTRYRPKLMLMITSQFYAPDFLKPELENRITMKVENMKKLENLPHLCDKQQIWTQRKGSSLGANLLTTPNLPVSSNNPVTGSQSTGSWG